MRCTTPFYRGRQRGDLCHLCTAARSVQGQLLQARHPQRENEATGQWEKVPSYSVEDLFPYGHGEKSVFLIERFMKLHIEEAVAIRWHMGGFDDAARGGCFAISEAYDKYPLAVKLHIADLEATYLMEHRTSAVR